MRHVLPSLVEIDLRLVRRRKRALASQSCAELVFDQYFEGLWSVR